MDPLAQQAEHCAKKQREALGTSSRDSRLPPEVAFLAQHDEHVGALLVAIIESAKCGASADRILLGEGLVEEEDFYRLLADHLNAPFYDGELAIAENVDVTHAVWSGVAPLAPNDQGLQFLLAPRGAGIARLLSAAQHGVMPEAAAIAPPRRFEATIRVAASRALAHGGAFDLKAFDADFSADRRTTEAQATTAAAIVCLAPSLWLLRANLLTAAYSIAFFIVFLSAIGLRLAAAAAARTLSRPVELLLDAELPIYSIVAPLSGEANMIGQLVASFDRLSYPRAKLEIIFVVEQDDTETSKAIEQLGLPTRYQIVHVPPGEPRTKPRALNIALPSVRGAYVVVFDAEDMPEPDQLRIAATIFATAPDIGCLQARLAVNNAETSWLSALYAIEYATLFHVLNPGLSRLNAPIALGGTSNHFQAHVLRRVGGWDAWNLTEDADLGLRLARFGVRVAMFDSDTYEEAPTILSQWLGQRRRWQKGWLQTALVHSRNPARLLRELGLARAIGAVGLIGGGVFGGFFGPLFTIGAIWSAIFGNLLEPSGFLQGIVTFTTIAMLVLGLASILIPTIKGLRRAALAPLAAKLVLLPFYYCLISAATWLAAWDLVYKPFHWRKTPHGLAARLQLRPRARRKTSLGD
jgi:glycosyltransferase XagB